MGLVGIAGAARLLVIGGHKAATTERLTEQARRVFAVGVRTGHHSCMKFTIINPLVRRARTPPRATEGHWQQ